MTDQQTSDLDVAVVGMACEFPGAHSPGQFWANLRDGVETVRFFTDEELRARGVPEADLRDPEYVKAASTLDDIASFDAEFFGMNANEARATDPQHRLFLECCWTALEDAGYDPERYEGDIGVFGGLGMNGYLYEVLGRHADFWRSTGQEQMMIGNDKDFLPSRVSYKLNLTGPSVNVNTACSTSLVAVHMARQSLLLGESDMALVGGVSIVVPGDRGYRYVKDGIRSPDGHCRAFDARAQGTVWGDGCGVVVLKRLSEALAEGDRVLATVKGSAVNNDGSLKVGYTAPSVEGQSRVVAEALADADVSPSDIGYVEAHGTGTRLGDPIEIAALNQAFGPGTDHEGRCAIGSVKTNIGHLNAAAGIAGFIKTVLALRHGELPPTLNFTDPNPEIDFAAGPFRVQTRLSGWPRRPGPRRAGVSAMGIGGTNCHVVLEEAPQAADRAPGEHFDGQEKGDGQEQVLLLSARSAAALEASTDDLAGHLTAHPGTPLADVAYTLQCGRRHFRHRRAVVCASTDEAARILRSRDPGALLTGYDSPVPPPARPALARWLAGEEVDWRSEWPEHGGRRVPLPTYPFERRRYWYEPPSARHPDRPQPPVPDEDYFTKSPDLADWFSVPVWKQDPAHFTPAGGQPRTHLVFADDEGLADGVLPELAARGDTVVRVAAGGAYRRHEDGSFTLEPSDDAGFVSLLRALRDDQRAFDSVLFFWPLRTGTRRPDPLDREAVLLTQQCSSFALLRLAKALEEIPQHRPLRLTAFTRDVCDVTGDEPLNVPDSTVAGACLVLQQTYGQIAAGVVDLTLPASGVPSPGLVRTVLKEIRRESDDLIRAYRGGRRYVRGYERVRVEERSPAAPAVPAVPRGGVHLVFGALEGIGHRIAEHLAADRGGTVLILEEPGFPPPAEWQTLLADGPEGAAPDGQEGAAPEPGPVDDPVANPADPVTARIRRAQALISQGAEYVGTLSPRPEDNARLLAELEARFGPVTGVVHAPGASNAKRVRTIRATTVDSWSAHFDAVGHSFVLLDAMFSGRALDFRVLTSSLGSVLGGDGFFHVATIGGYAKAHAVRQARTGRPWTVQCWDSWTVEWSGIVHHLPTAFYERVGPSVLTSEEGLRSFDRALTVTDEVELLISATDFRQRYHKWVVSTRNAPSAEPAGAAPAPDPRPELETAYVAPSTPVEEELAELFGRILGLEKIGVDDNFFTLGGHSLLGVQLASEIRESRPVDISLAHLYRKPTVGELAAYIGGQL